MATLLLSAAGAAAGSALAPAGVSLLGASLSGAAIGQAVGGALGGVIDRAVFGDAGAVVREGPRLDALPVMGAHEGAPLARIYGRARVSGQVIWATRFRETVQTDTRGAGGKGGGGSVKTREHRYSVSLAVALCEGPISGLGRIWANGAPLEQSDVVMRLHTGGADQPADPLIVALQGVDRAPAYNGVAYVVFDDLPLAAFGNRIPQFSFEVFAPPPSWNGAPRMEERLRAVTVIPASGEFVYGTSEVTRELGDAAFASENRHAVGGETDFETSLNALSAHAPDLEAAALVVAWFGRDLRCAQTAPAPAVESRDRRTEPYAWRVSGMARDRARVVSRIDGAPAFGGTPSDRAVREGIERMKARGLAVTFYPFILMDIPPDADLPDPRGGAQPAFPWRGRITCDPAPEVAGTVDQTAAAAAQVAALFGAAKPGDFGRWDRARGTIPYSGPAEWSLRRMTLHYAKLCAEAGGVDAFIIGSELVGLTRVRASATAYPAVAELKRLAADVRAILGPSVKIGYAANWNEYGAHAPADGSGDVLFPLDPLWSDPAIDFVGIDNYLPLTDWRDGVGHLDYDPASGRRSVYDAATLEAGVEKGEWADWYYASAADRDAQRRTPITDTAHGEDWVFGVKRLRDWWASPHFPRPGGARAASPTAWVPASKPIWFTELGCPAVDKGANQPNVFFDPKSSETALPWYSDGGRDDWMQRRYLETVLAWWDPAAGRNPVSPIYRGPMVEPARIFVWTWDARPFPEFPGRDTLWRDAENWRLGHWLTGRLGVALLADVVADLCRRAGLEDFDVSALRGYVDGYVVDRPMSARAALEPLMRAFFFDAVESGAKLVFRPRDAAAAPIEITDADLALRPDARGAEPAAATLTRAQESDLPLAARIGFVDGYGDYERAAVEARRIGAASERVTAADLPIVLDDGRARAIVDRWLHEAWVSREGLTFAAGPASLAIEPGDLLRFRAQGLDRPLRVLRVSDDGARLFECAAVDPAPWTDGAGSALAGRFSPTAAPAPAGPVTLELVDAPLTLDDDADGRQPTAFAFASPWLGARLDYGVGDAGVGDGGVGGGGAAGRSLTLARPATLGETLTPLPPGPEGRWDRATSLDVRLYAGMLESRAPARVLAGANVALVAVAGGGWEIFQFTDAEAIAPRTWRLSGFLRAQNGTDPEMRAGAPAGARFILFDGAGDALALGLDELGLDISVDYGPATRAVDDPAWRHRTARFAGNGLRPRSPTGLTAARDPIDDAIALRWIRRARYGGDNWEREAPLGEARESYRLDIRAGGVLRRRLEVETPEWRYEAAARAADLGSADAAFTVDVAQVSAIYGPGAPRRLTVAAR